MDSNTIVVLIGIGVLLIAAKDALWSLVSRIAPGLETTLPNLTGLLPMGDKPLREVEPARSTVEGQLPLGKVLEHLNDRRDEVPHFICVGSTGAGKSTFARVVLSPRVLRGEQYVIITGKRTSVFDDVWTAIHG